MDDGWLVFTLLVVEEALDPWVSVAASATVAGVTTG